jgi:anti-anti-sigma factor
MNIKKEKIKNFNVLKIKGRVDTVHSVELETELNQMFESGEKHLIFNCSKMDYISSSGLRVFLVAQKKVISLKGELYLCSLQPGIKEIFKITGFSNLFKIYDEQEEIFNNQ